MLMRDPVALSDDAIDDVKVYLRINTPDDDALIASLMATALVRAEDFCAQMFINRNVSEMMQAQREWQVIGAVPVTAIAQINAVALDGTSTPLSPLQFSVDIDKDGCGWVRITDPNVQGCINILYTAGFSTGWGTLPEAIRHGVIRLTAYLYTSRDAVVDNGPPVAVAALLRPWRRMRLTSPDRARRTFGSWLR